MPYALEHWGKSKAIVVNTQTGKHFSTSPIPLATAKKQMRLLYGIESGMIPKKEKREDK